MPEGLEVYNDNGVFQIDGNRRNFQLKQSGSGTCNTSETTGGRTRYYTTIAVTSSTAPLFFIGGNTNVCGLYGISVSGSTWTFQIVSNTNGATFNYWVFDAQDTAPDNFGLEVWNAAGQRVFHSGGKPLRIVGVQNGATTVTYTAGRTYAVCQTSSGFQVDFFDFDPNDDVHQYQAFYQGSQISGTTVTTAISIYEIYIASDPPPDPYYDAPFFIIADVTNF